MYWRINGTRQMVGGRRVIQSEASKLDEEEAMARYVSAGSQIERVSDQDVSDTSRITIAFTAGGKYSVSEGDPYVTVSILRTGDLKSPVVVKYKTINGTAKANEDYVVRARLTCMPCLLFSSFVLAAACCACALRDASSSPSLAN